MQCPFCNKTIKRKLSFANIFSSPREEYCKTCQENIYLKEYLHENHILYYLADYDFLKEIIYSIKYKLDLAQAEKFKLALQEFFKEYKFDLILIAPSNLTREAIRGFNHIKAMADICQLKYQDIFIEKYRAKQSKLKTQRKHHEIEIRNEYLELVKNSSSILIIDDIFTSGKTLESLSLSLKEINPEVTISFFCLAKS